MEYRKLGKTEVSAIGLGTLRAFDVSSDEDIAVRSQIVDNCIVERVNLIDCASAYGAAEHVVGVTTKGRRDSFHLASKVRCEGKEAGEAQIAQSFELFQTDYIELYQIHNMIDWETHLPTLETLKDEGRIGMIGVTAMVHEAYPVIVDLMKSGRIDTVQIPYNVIERGCEAEILPVAEELGVGILVMEPLKKGRYVKELKSEPDLAPLADLGVETWGQALLAWVLSDSRVSSAIPATSRPERIHENAKAGSIGPLTPELRDHVRRETERCL
ncbi:MAG: aldo/keto reductase [SAR202 cluster bacterium]|nr:aldo/keto reductase [SAR202 cluster bacterium]